MKSVGGSLNIEDYFMIMRQNETANGWILRWSDNIRRPDRVVFKGGGFGNEPSEMSGTQEC